MHTPVVAGTSRSSVERSDEATRSSSKSYPSMLVRLGIGLVFGCWAALFIVHSSFVAIDGARYFVLFDDAMVSMRYAWNVSHGHGLVWNAGERVEGYTNLLMTLLMVLPTGVLPARLAALPIQILGIAFVFLSAYLAAWIAQRGAGYGPGRGQIVGVLTFAGVAFCYPLAYWSLMGMETGLLTVLLLGAVALTLRRPEPTEAIGLGVLWGLCYLARPDALIFAAVMAAYLVWCRRHRGESLRASVQAVLPALATLAIVVGAQLIFRVATYGELAPNTYVLKIDGVPLVVRVANGLKFLGSFFLSGAPLLLAAVVGLVRRPCRQKTLLASLFLSTVLYQIWTGGDAWPLWRLIDPTLPLVIALAACGAVEVARLLSGSPRPTRLRRHTFAVGAACALVAVGLVALDHPFSNEILGLAGPYEARANHANVDTGVALAAVTTPGARLGVFWAGSIVFFADRDGVDFLGKSDSFVARLPPDLSGAVSGYGMSTIPGHNKYDLDYSIERLQPTYVQGFAWGQQDLWQTARDEYQLVHYRGVPLWLRKDSPDVRWDLVDS